VRANLAICLALIALPLLALRRVSDPSPWLHLKVGQFLLAGGQFGSPDPWAPFASHAYVPTQWLPSVVSAELFARFGTPAIAWERAAGITLLAFALLLWASTLARLWVALTTAGLAVFAAWPSLTERPQLAGFLLLVPVLAAWWRTGMDGRPRWWLIPLTWLAAATHGIWATAAGLGTLVTITLLLSRRLTRRESLRLFAVLAACAVAAGLTPIGPRLLLTPFAVSGQGRQFIQEWMPSSVRSPHVLAVLLMLAAAWLSWIALQRRPPAWQVVLLLTGVGLSLTMQRTVAVAALVALPLACTAVESWISQGLPTRPPRQPWPAWIGAAAAGILIAIPLSSNKAADIASVPTRLAPALTSLAADSRILVDSDHSGWLMFTVPHVKPIYDLRVESYSPQHVRRYIAVMNAEPGWDEFISESQATAALVPIDSPVRAALTEQSHWVEVGTDAGLVLLRAPA
jgi:hypothetical protein